MLYIIKLPLFVIFLVISLICIIMGVFSFLWKFKKKDFYKGTAWLQSKTGWADYADKYLIIK